MKNIVAIIEDLRKCATTINETANWLAEQFGSNSEPVSVEPVLALEAVRAVLAKKSREGFTAQIRSILQKHGSDKLSGIDPAKYKALLADVEGLANDN